MKHTKPFTCMQRSCPKHKVGFTTSNDLRRHMKALHGYRYKSSPSSRGLAGGGGGDGSAEGGDTAEVGAPVDIAVGGWRCRYCALMDTPNFGLGVTTRSFFSTRKDNFRNHIKRIHIALKKEGESMDEFFRRSEIDCRVDSPILMPTLPSPETPLAMDADIDSSEAAFTRVSENRTGMTREGMDASSQALHGRGILPSVDAWQGLPPPVHNSQAVHGYARHDPMSEDTNMNGGDSAYDSVIASRSADRGPSRYAQQGDQHGEMGRSQYLLQRSDCANVDTGNSGGYLDVAGRSRQVEQSNGPEHPTGSSKFPELTTNGWATVNSATYNPRTVAVHGQQTENLSAHHTHTNSSVVRDAGAKSHPEAISISQAIAQEKEELRRLERQEQDAVQELDRIRALKKKVQDRLSQHERLLISPQPNPTPAARRTEEDVEMSGAPNHTNSRWSAQADKIIPASVGGLSLSQLLNAEDSTYKPIGSGTNMGRIAMKEASAAHEDLFVPPKPASSPPRWQYPAATGSPQISPSAIAPPRRPQSWYNNRVKPGSASTAKDGSKEYKALCPHCQSSFRLPCQLRKHLKRHSKPFGCTHDGCHKVFGAKNDWKRHENSQHHQLECWKCDIRSHTCTPGTDTADICGKCFFRKADFIKHLKLIHGNADGWATTADQNSTTTNADQVPVTFTRTGNRDFNQIIVDCHIPKYHGGAFWCGFCHKVIKLDGKVGIEGWDKRFDHIASHFEKEGRRVQGGWMRLEEPSPEDEGKGAGASRSKDADVDSSDEDVEPTDSLPKRRHTESTQVPSYARQQSQVMKASGSEKPVRRWYCCKCKAGPFLDSLFTKCTSCCEHTMCNCCPDKK